MGKGGRCVRLTNLPPSCAVVMKSGNLNFLEPSGLLHTCNGTALPLPYSLNTQRGWHTSKVMGICEGKKLALGEVSRALMFPLSLSFKTSPNTHSPIATLYDSSSWNSVVNSWRRKDQLDVTSYFISLLMCSTCFGH